MLVAGFAHFVSATFAPQHKSFNYHSGLDRQAVKVRRLRYGTASSSPPSTGNLSMANSRFQYVKKFELSDALLPDTYLVARLDGHRFTRFTADHGYIKPNDERGLLLMAEVLCTLL